MKYQNKVFCKALSPLFVPIVSLSLSTTLYAQTPDISSSIQDTLEIGGNDENKTITYSGDLAINQQLSFISEDNTLNVRGKLIFGNNATILLSNSGKNIISTGQLNISEGVHITFPTPAGTPLSELQIIIQDISTPTIINSSNFFTTQNGILTLALSSLQSSSSLNLWASNQGYNQIKFSDFKSDNKIDLILGNIQAGNNGGGGVQAQNMSHNLLSFDTQDFAIVNVGNIQAHQDGNNFLASKLLDVNQTQVALNNSLFDIQNFKGDETSQRTLMGGDFRSNISLGTQEISANGGANYININGDLTSSGSIQALSGSNYIVARTLNASNGIIANSGGNNYITLLDGDRLSNGSKNIITKLEAIGGNNTLILNHNQTTISSGINISNNGNNHIQFEGNATLLLRGENNTITDITVSEGIDAFLTLDGNNSSNGVCATINQTLNASGLTINFNGTQQKSTKLTLSNSDNILSTITLAKNSTNNTLILSQGSTTFNNMINITNNQSIAFDMSDNTTLNFNDGARILSNHNNSIDGIISFNINGEANLNGEIDNQGVLNLNVMHTTTTLKSDSLAFLGGITAINFTNSTTPPSTFSLKAQDDTLKRIEVDGGELQVNFNENGILSNDILTSAITNVFVANSKTAELLGNLENQNDGKNFIIFEGGATSLTLKGAINTLERISFATPNPTSTQNTTSTLILDATSNATNTTLTQSLENSVGTNLAITLKGTQDNQASFTLLSGDNQLKTLNIETDKNNIFALNQGNTAIIDNVEIASSKALILKMSNDANLTATLNNTGGETTLLFATGTPTFAGTLSLSGGTTTLQVGEEDNRDNVIATLQNTITMTNTPTLNLLFVGGSILSDTSKHTAFTLNSNSNVFTKITSQSSNALLNLNGGANVTVSDKISIEDGKALRVGFTEDGDSTIAANGGVEIAENAALGISIGGSGNKTINGGNITLSNNSTILVDFLQDSTATVSLGGNNNLTIGASHQSIINFWGSSTSSLTSALTLDGGNNTINFYNGEATLRGITLTSGNNTINVSQNAIGHIDVATAGNVTNTINLKGGILSLDDNSTMGSGILTSSSSITNTLNFLQDGSILAGGFGANGSNANAQINVSSNGIITGSVKTDSDDANATLQFNTNDTSLTLQGNTNILTKISASSLGGNLIILDGKDNNSDVSLTIKQELIGGSIGIGFGSGSENKKTILDQPSMLGKINLANTSTNNTVVLNSGINSIENLIGIQSNQGIGFELNDGANLAFNNNIINTEGMLTFNLKGNNEVSGNITTITQGNTVFNLANNASTDTDIAFLGVISTQSHAQTTFNIGENSTASTTIKFRENLSNSSNGVNIFNLQGTQTIIQGGSEGLAFSSGINFINFEQNGSLLKWQALDQGQDTQAKNITTTSSGKTLITFGINGEIEGGVESKNGALTTIALFSQAQATISKNLIQDGGFNNISFDGSSSLSIAGENNAIHQISIQTNTNASLSAPNATIETISFEANKTRSNTSSSFTLSGGNYEIENLNSLSASSLILDASSKAVSATINSAIQSEQIDIHFKGDTNNSSTLTLNAENNTFKSLTLASSSTNNHLILKNGQTNIADTTTITNDQALSINLANNQVSLINNLSNTGGNLEIIFSKGEASLDGTLNLNGGITTLQVGTENNTENILASLKQDASNNTPNSTLNLLFKGGASLSDMDVHTTFVLGDRSVFSNITSQSSNAQLKITSPATISNKIIIEEQKALLFDFGDGDLSIGATNGLEIKNNATIGISLSGNGTKNIQGNITSNDTYNLNIVFQPQNSSILDTNSTFSIGTGSTSTITFNGETQIASNIIALNGGINTVNFNSGNATLRGITLNSGTNIINVAPSAIGHIQASEVAAVNNTINLRGGNLYVDTQDTQGIGSLISSTITNTLNFLGDGSTLFGNFGASGSNAKAQINIEANGIISGNIIADNQASTILNFNMDDTTITLQGEQNTISKITGTTINNTILLDLVDGKNSTNIQAAILEKFSHQNVVLSYGDGEENKKFTLNQGGELGGIKLFNHSINNTFSTLSQSTIFTQEVQIADNQSINFEMGNDTILAFTQGLSHSAQGNTQLTLTSSSATLSGSKIALNTLKMNDQGNSTLYFNAMQSDIDTLIAQHDDIVTLQGGSTLNIYNLIDGEIGGNFDQGDETKTLALYSPINSLSHLTLANNSTSNVLALKNTQTSINQNINIQSDQELMIKFFGEQNILQTNFELNGGTLIFEIGEKNAQNSTILLNGTIEAQSIYRASNPQIVLNLYSKENIFENGINGLELTNLDTIINFLEPQSTLMWENQSGELVDLITQNGNTKINFYSSSSIAKGIVSKGATTTLNLNNGTQNTIAGNLLLENNGKNHIVFDSQDQETSLSLGDQNTISSITINPASSTKNILNLTSSSQTHIDELISLKGEQNLTFKLNNTQLQFSKGLSLEDESKAVSIFEVGVENTSSNAQISGETLEIGMIQFLGENSQLNLNNTKVSIQQINTQATNAILKFDTPEGEIENSFNNVGIVLGATQNSRITLNGSNNTLNSLVLEGIEQQDILLTQGITIIEQAVKLATNQKLQLSLNQNVKLSSNNGINNMGGKLDISFTSGNTILNSAICTSSGITTLNVANNTNATFSKSITTENSAQTHLYLLNQSSIDLQGEENTFSIFAIQSDATLLGQKLNATHTYLGDNSSTNLFLKNSYTSIDNLHNDGQDRLTLDASNNATKVSIAQIDAPINISLIGKSQKNFTNLSFGSNVDLKTLDIRGDYNTLDLTQSPQVDIQNLAFQSQTNTPELSSKTMGLGAINIELSNTQLNAAQGLKNTDGKIAFKINSNNSSASTIFTGNELSINSLIFQGKNDANLTLKSSKNIIETINADTLNTRSIILDGSNSLDGISLTVSKNLQGNNLSIQLGGELNKPATLNLEGLSNQLYGILLAQNSAYNTINLSNGETTIQSTLDIAPNQSLDLNINNGQLRLYDGIQTQNDATSTINFYNTNNAIYLNGSNNQITNINGNGNISLSNTLTVSPKSHNAGKHLLVSGQIQGNLDFTLLVDTHNKISDHISIQKTQNAQQHHTLHLAFANANPSDINQDNQIALATYNDSNDHISFEIGNTTLGFETISVQTQTQETDFNANTQGKGYQTIFLSGIERLGIVEAEQKITASAFTFNYDLYMANFNSLNKRMGELRENSKSQGIWARIFNGSQINDFGLGSKSNYTTIQAGYDYAFGGEGYNNYLGFALSYALAISTSNQAFDSNGVQRKLEGIYSNAFEGAIYNSYVSDYGWYNDTIVKFSYLMNNFEINNLNNQTSNKNMLTNYAITLSNEVGYRVGFGENDAWFADPQIEIGFGYFSQGNFKQILENIYYLDAKASSMMTLRGRAGLSLGYDFKNFSNGDGTGGNLYVGSFYEFDYVRGGEILMTTQSGVENNQYSNIKSDGRIVLNMGTNIKIKDHTRLYLDFEKSFLGKIRTEYQVNFGVRFGFGEENEYRVKSTQENQSIKSNLEIENKVSESGFYIEVLNTNQTLTQEQIAILKSFDYKTQRNQDGSLSFLIGPYETKQDLLSKILFFDKIAKRLGGKIKGIKLNIQPQE